MDGHFSNYFSTEHFYQTKDIVIDPPFKMISMSKISFTFFANHPGGLSRLVFIVCSAKVWFFMAGWAARGCIENGGCTDKGWFAYADCVGIGWLADADCIGMSWFSDADCVGMGWFADAVSKVKVWLVYSVSSMSSLSSPC